jgi:hypothetical protein
MRQGRPQRPGNRPAPPGHHPEERQAEPQTQGKVERFQQTLKKWLRAEPAQPADLASLQHLLDLFTGIYNDQRPHRSLPHRATPVTAHAARPKAVPGDRTTDAHHRVRTDRVDANGKLTLRLGGRLHHIGIGRTHARTRVLSSSRTSTSASSTPPPANSSANSS